MPIAKLRKQTLSLAIFTVSVLGLAGACAAQARRDPNDGRTARLAMNCMLSAANLSRIMVPTVYREDYLLPLKALSDNEVAEPLLAALSRAQRWSAAFDYNLPRPALRNALAGCNTFQENIRNYRLLFP